MLWLITQILFCLLIAWLLGLLLGWLLWGRRPAAEPIEREDRAALEASKARVRELERDLAECHAKAAAAPVASAAAEGAPPAYGLFGPVAERPIDDLKVISGIGPVIERQLAGIGVTTYRQIAEFDGDDIERVQEAIDFFPGRIEREDWLSQATKLHEEKYGSPS